MKLRNEKCSIYSFLIWKEHDTQYRFLNIHKCNFCKVKYFSDEFRYDVAFV